MCPWLRLTPLAALLLLACGGGKAEGEGDEGAGPPLDDTGGGGDGEDTWGPSGSGIAYFLDGSGDNSLFHLEISNTQPPREGEAYQAFLVRADGSVVSMGAVPVTSNSVIFEADIGMNALVEGLTTLEVWAGPAGAGQGSGTLLWGGTVDPALTNVYLELLLVDAEVATGEGSLRAVETTTETLISLTEAITTATASSTELNAFAREFEDSIEGGPDAIAGTSPILGPTGAIELILADLDAASAAVEPGHPVKDLANYAYDCTQRIEAHVEDAVYKAGIASVSAGEEVCDGLLLDAAAFLSFALNGEDIDGDGAVDPITEGTIECAITYASQMAYMDVAVP